MLIKRPERYTAFYRGIWVVGKRTEVLVVAGGYGFLKQEEPQEFL